MPHALTITEVGDQPTFALSPVHLASPGPGEVLVDWHWAALNRADLLYPRGQYFSKPAKGSRLGFEAAGIVRQAGPDTQLRAGDAVAILPLSIDIATQGSLAESGIYRETQLIPCSTALSLEQHAAFWMAFLTAYGGMVEQGHLSAGQHVLITAASSAVGLACLQLGKALGATTIATTTSEEKCALLRQSGATHALIQPREEKDFEHFVAQIKHLTMAQGCELIFDAVAGPASRALIQSSRRGGRYIIHGMLDRRPMNVHAGVLMKRLLSLQGYTLDQTLTETESRQTAIAALEQLASEATVQPKIDKRFTLLEAPQALDYLATNQHLGKVLVDCRLHKK